MRLGRGSGIGKVLLKKFQNLDLSDSSSSSCGFQKLDHYSQASIPVKHSSEIVFYVIGFTNR